MAFPQIRDSITSLNNGNTTSHTLELPVSVVAGDLIIAIIATDGDNTFGWPDEGTTWHQIFELSSGKVAALGAAWKIAVGGEGGTSITVTSTSDEISSCLSYSISAHGSDVNVPEGSTGATGDSANANPDSYTATWGSDDNLWIAMCGVNGNSAGVSVYPYADNNVTTGNSNNQGCSIGVCSDEIATDVEDPGTFTNLDDDWVAGTIVVSPALKYQQKIMVGSIFT